MAQDAIQRKGGKGEADSMAYQKLLQEASELKESLRLERSRNDDTDRKWVK